MESDSSLQSWQWVLIALGIISFIAIASFIIWSIKNRNIRRSSNASGIYDEEKDGPTSPASAETIIVDEGVDVSKVKEIREVSTTSDGGQQFAHVPQGLSPPKRGRKESNNGRQPPPTLAEKVQQEEEREAKEREDDLGKMRGVFSLSPPYFYQQQQEPSTSIHSMTPRSSIIMNRNSGINCSNSQGNTPFNTPGHNTIPSSLVGSMWRGPTPPWTQQYSPCQKSLPLDSYQQTNK